MMWTALFVKGKCAKEEKFHEKTNFRLHGVHR